MKIFVYFYGNGIAGEHLEDAEQPGGVDDVAALLYDVLGFQRGADAFVHVVGRKAYLIPTKGFHENAFDGGNGIFGRDSPHGGVELIEQLLFGKYDFHGKPFSAVRSLSLRSVREKKNT